VFAATLACMLFIQSGALQHWLWLGDIQSRSVQISIAPAGFENCKATISLHDIESPQWRHFPVTLSKDYGEVAPIKQTLDGLVPLTHVSVFSSRRTFRDMPDNYPTAAKRFVSL